MLQWIIWFVDQYLIDSLSSSFLFILLFLFPAFSIYPFTVINRWWSIAGKNTSIGANPILCFYYIPTATFPLWLWVLVSQRCCWDMFIFHDRHIVLWGWDHLFSITGSFLTRSKECIVIPTFLAYPGSTKTFLLCQHWLRHVPGVNKPAFSRNSFCLH